jgi:hypothetical protein
MGIEHNRNSKAMNWKKVKIPRGENLKIARRGQPKKKPLNLKPFNYLNT